VIAWIWCEYMKTKNDSADAQGICGIEWMFFVGNDEFDGFQVNLWRCRAQRKRATLLGWLNVARQFAKFTCAGSR
jgi:hypothetical protein